MNRMIVGLSGNERLLRTHQKLLCLGQRQPQTGDIGKLGGPIDLHQINTPRRAARPHFDQSQNPPHALSPGRK
jgi:hypothetical protein